MKARRRVVVLSLILVFVFLVSALSTSSGKLSWVITPVDNSNRAAEHANPAPPIIMKGYKPVGSLSSTYPITVTIAIPLNNLALLQSMEAAISNPDSSEYRQFLSQQTIQQLFLPVAQYQATLNYLQSHDFSIAASAENSIIVATTTVGQLQSFLGLQTTLYSNGTDSYYSASGSPTIPGVYVYSSNITGLVVHNSLILGRPSSIVTVSRGGQQISSGVPNETAPMESYQAPRLLSAYNASSLVSSGYDGKGEGIGILEFGGDPYIAQELAVYDKETGLPAPPSLNVVSVGPNNPSIGVVEQVPGEEELDVEFSHAMAPGANVTVYSGNYAEPFAPVIAMVDQQDIVNVFSQSWGESENYFPFLGVSFYMFNVVLPDEYYMLGSAEGITFTDSSGDGGGSGYASQPVGTIDYPASSPYVTATGGTTTFLTFNGSKVTSSYQTAWSNEGFENPLANFGGGSGGVSAVEPRPWYQDAITEPATYENGRMEPDISLNANVYPAVFEVGDTRTFSSSAGYVNEPTGGTSESAPLFAGLIADVDQKIGGSLGLVNPALYEIGESHALYPKEFIPITFGYITPWVSSYGYNLATGWGAPNIGELADYFSSRTPGPAPIIQVAITNSKGRAQFEFPSGGNIMIAATSKGISSSTPFTAELVTLQGTLVKVPLVYSNAQQSWTGEITVPPSASGLSDLNVNATVNGEQVFGFAQVFTSYFATILSPLSVQEVQPAPSEEMYITIVPYSTLLGFNVSASITDLNGHAVSVGSYGFTAFSYSLLTNTYDQFLSQPLKFSMAAWNAPLIGNYPLGPELLILNGVYGFVPFLNGVGLSTSFIVPPTSAEPGVVSPGQSIEIEGELAAPANTPNLIGAEMGIPISQELQIGSNMTASLVSPSGEIVSSTSVGALAVPGTYFGFPYNYLGYLQVPADARQGLYTILLNSTYKSIDLNGFNFNGSFFGQIWVSGQQAIVPKITLSPNPVNEGQTLQIQANIAYANGTEVKYGMYSATLYPAYDSNNYAAYSGTPAGQVPLWYDPTLNLWVGNVTMPSPTSLGWLGGETYFDPGLPGVVSQPVAGPWDVYISGVSADGVGTTTIESAQQSFAVTP